MCTEGQIVSLSVIKNFFDKAFIGMVCFTENLINHGVFYHRPYLFFFFLTSLFLIAYRQSFIAFLCFLFHDLFLIVANGDECFAVETFNQ